ncbi:MAG: RagB/SusD family nutrient uptake outer membrane protein [Proteiniphilum sp.]|nr:RagB/SusD family nutrient uptake outer membrane protein [Proteiniphilum sp.]MDD4157949.1 RagB/SusD family nutrient uptake outer membrane protein [Proteiniphilum sp.]MDD4800720.1 RagB/SusD family nutrient uptake outer membrane protein [Proteiniphilum sp.]
MKYNPYTLLIICLFFFITGCEDFLDRPPLTVANDETVWDSEDKVRLYANKYYTDFFVGYNSGWGYTGAPLMGFTFSDDIIHNGSQGNFTRSVPNSQVWNMKLIRSINIMLNRIENKMQGILSTEASNHWMGVGRFFRAIEYADIATAYGDVPYYDHVVSDTDLDDLYKPRTPRNEVMDHVYDDLLFAFKNIRLNDGNQYVNRYIAAGFISRIALCEGSWQKYYYHDNERAKKFFTLAVNASDFIIQSGRYDIVTEFRDLFTSENLSGNKDCVLYRHYDQAVGITHSIASNNNLSESVNFGPTADLIKSFICRDGKVWQNSELEGAGNFELTSMIQTRDPRLEATFYDKPTPKNKGSFWYINKFLPRSVAKSVEAGNAPPVEFTSTNNRTDYPVMRYAEVLLNWIEAKAELATLGDGTVTQADIDLSVNKIRNRPLAAEAIAMGVQKTAPMQLSALPDDPDRDVDVSSLIWEIRRERRMEFVFEHSRYADLKRWYKLEYMDTDLNGYLLAGGWVNFPRELKSELKTANAGLFSVIKLNKEEVTYNGGNNAQMKGFYKSSSTSGRQPFLNQVNVNPYLAPVGKTQIDDYASKGYVLQQTEGWPQN